MSHFTSRFPYFLSAVVGVISGVYIFQPALQDIARISRENEAKYRMEQMEQSLAATAGNSTTAATAAAAAAAAAAEPSSSSPSSAATASSSPTGPSSSPAEHIKSTST